MPIFIPFFLSLSVCLATVSASSVYAPSYKTKVYADEVLPYTYKYAVADDYSKVSFSADESSDGASNVQGSYSVALPDGRIQRVTYTANGYDGYVADVTYEGTAQYPEPVSTHKPYKQEYIPIINHPAPAQAPAPAPVAAAFTYSPANRCPKRKILRGDRCVFKFRG